MAAISGLAAGLAILICCLVWIGLGWAEGGASAMLAAIICCLFAAMDDPTPALRIVGFAVLAALPLSGFYLFYVFPSINSFPLLVLTLAPPLIGIGALVLNPRYALPAMMMLLGFCNMMAIQQRVSTDFASYVNFNISQFFGIFTAIYVIRSIRVMSADTSARRLLSHTWKNIARLAQGRGDAEPAVFASRMVDRLSLLVPRLAASRATTWPASTHSPNCASVWMSWPADTCAANARRRSRHGRRAARCTGRALRPAQRRRNGRRQPAPTRRPGAQALARPCRPRPIRPSPPSSACAEPLSLAPYAPSPTGVSPHDE